MTKIFKIPFATQGDRTVVPDEVQADGSLSYTQGYGYDYERDQATDPAAKDIEREKMNSLFHDITGAVGEIQAFGMPVWAEEGKPYAIRSIVYHNKKAWQSKIENNNTEPAAGVAWTELKADMTAGDVGAYTKGEADQKFQPLGNYLPAGYSYSKNESDTRFQPKGNYAPAGNYAMKGDSYTKAEGDGRYQAKGNYAPAGDYAVKGESYTKSESDNKYQQKGSYQEAGYSYSKAESDNKYQPKGSYLAAGYSYSKAESDNKYQPKGDYALKSDVAGLIKPGFTMFAMQDEKDIMPPWYSINGDRYGIDTPQGKVLRSFSADLKARWNIIQTAETITLPRVLQPDGRMPFPRPVNGTNRKTGVVSGDTIRNIKGEIGYDSTHGLASSDNDVSGAFYRVGASKRSFSDMGASGQTTNIAFSADRDVPTGPENKPLDIGATWVVYLGV